VQHLGYHEFVELGRVAVRTLEQKKIIVNNLAIRRATEALSKTKSIDEIERVLREAFEGNDFDAFDLELAPNAVSRLIHEYDRSPQIEWQKMSSGDGEAANEGDWKLALDLKPASSRNLGTFTLYRRCSGSPLLVDVNLLIAGFNTALSGAIERTMEGDPREAAATLQLDGQPLIPALSEGGAEG
jgi:hypothetical protein